MIGGVDAYVDILSVLKGEDFAPIPPIIQFVLVSSGGGETQPRESVTPISLGVRCVYQHKNDHQVP